MSPNLKKIIIEADLGFRFRYESGRAVWPLDTINGFANWMGSLDGVVLNTAGGVGNTIVAGDPQNPRYLPSTTILDLSLGRNFKIGNAGAIWASLDVLNATNENTVNKASFGAGPSEVGSLTRPRVVRLSLRYDF